MNHSANGDGNRGPRCPINRAREGRRERHRREFLTDIARTTRNLVVGEGQESVTMAAVANHLGVTPPALYRYTSGRSGLIYLACLQVSAELTEHLRQAREQAGAEPLDQLLAGCRALRRWALDHRAEFTMLFAHPVTQLGDPQAEHHEETSAAIRAFGWTLEEPALRLWKQRPLVDHNADEGIPEELRSSMAAYRDRLVAHAAEVGLDVSDLPIAVPALIMRNWTQIFGQIWMEVFDQISYAASDGEPMFEWMLAELTHALTGRPQAG